MDVYLTREYVEASTLLEPGRPLFLRTEQAVFAAILREGPTDVISPYGYGGPVGPGFWEPYDDWCRANGVVSTFVRFHPLYANHRDAGPIVRVEQLGPTVGWRLDDDDDLFERMHRHHRRVVRKAVSAGVEAMATLRPESLEPFARLYEQTMERQQAEGFYYFPPEYWRALETELRNHVVLFEAGEDAALLCLHAPPWLHYHLGASSEAGRKLGASNLLFLEAARWAAGARLRALPPRRRGRRQARLAVRVQAPLRPRRRARDGRRQGDPRRGGLPRARRPRRRARRLLPGLSRYGADVILKAIFWASLGGLAWTHVGYPVAAAALRRVREKEIAKDEITPSVTLIVPAHDEEDVIGARSRTCSSSTTRPTSSVSWSPPTARPTAPTRSWPATTTSAFACSPASAAASSRRMNRAVRESESELLAFGDANATWAPDALRKLVRSFADPEIAYVCGQVRFQRLDGSNKEGVYWRYEMWLRESESALGSITGGNGAIYAVRRSDYVEWPFGHDLGFPNLMVQRGRRAVYDPEALAFEKPSRDIEDEYRRKVRMLPWSWRHLFEARSLRGVPPLYLVELLSHRVLRYGSGFLHLALLATSIALVDEGWPYQAALAAQAAFLALAAAGKLKLPVPGAGLAYYYLLMTTATTVALGRYLREGAPLMWEKAEGTR